MDFNKLRENVHDRLLASQVKSSIINNAFYILQRATAQSKTGNICGYGVAEAPPGFQAGWSDCMYFFFSLCSLY
jgi:hypothetical protein